MKLKHITNRAVTFLLAVVLLTGCLIPHATNNETAQETGGISDPLSSTATNFNALSELSTANTLLPDPEAEAVYRERMQRECAEGILADSKIADYVSTNEFFETKPMFRLTALETLNSYVVQNADNTNTIYLMAENVKYVDAKGEIREKDIRLSANEKGFAVTDSDVKLLLPAKISDGISVNTDFGSITLTPRFRGDNAAILDEKSNSVSYNGAFGNGTFLRYTPTLSGVKEDIVLEARPESNMFEFLLDADGLTLYTEDGIYYLVSTENKDCRIRFDQIFIYDANGRFTAGKTEIVDAGHGRYTLTVTAPREFLDAAETVYPVTVDPSLSVLTETNSASIIDAPVHQGTPNMNAGTWSYDNIGYTDSTYGLARTVIKLSGLLSNPTYQNLTADKVTNVSFSAKEATGNSSKTVKLHPITGNPTWTETSVTWNNYGSFDTTVNYGGTLTGDQWTAFNITNLVKAWLNGSYNNNGCFIFIMGGTENSQCRALYSTEYSGTSNRPYLSMTYQPAVSFPSYSIYVNENEYALPACIVSPSGTYHYSWSIANTDIATCVNISYPQTQVCGLRAGNTNLTVTVRDPSNIIIGSATAFVFVLVPDGIYKLENSLNNGKLLTAGKTLPDQQLSTFLNAYSFSGNDPVTDQITQMWRIKHVVYNIYSIRPYFKLDMRLGKGDNYAAVTDYIGLGDGYNSQYSDYLWWITRDLSDKYIIQCDGTTRVLKAENWQDGIAPVTVKPDNNLGLSARWYFINVTSTAPTGVYLYDADTGVFNSGPIKYIAPEENRTIKEFNLYPASYSPNSIQQDFSWSSNLSINAVVSGSGTVTGISSGSAQLTGSIIISGSSYTVSFTVSVTQIPNGVYFIKNKRTAKYADIEGPYMTAGTQIHQWEFNGNNSQRWIFTHLGNGYYSIKSTNSVSDYYMGVQNDGTATDTPIVLRTGTLTDGMKWKVSVTTSGAYKITPKTGEPNNRVMAIESNSNNNGIDIQQREYVNDGNYNDEWDVENVQSFVYKTFTARIYYDSSVSLTINEINTIYENATSSFVLCFNLKFSLSSTAYSSALDCDSACHATSSTSICTDECAALYKCNSSHHRGSSRLKNILTSNSYYTYRLVGYALCYYDSEHTPIKHKPVIGLGDVNGKNAISSYATSEDITRSIQHELTHNLGGTHSGCTPGQLCVLKGNYNCWCDNCKQRIKNNY